MRQVHIKPEFRSVDKDVEDRVVFRPFVGVAPLRYVDLFTMLKRKNEDGSVVSWDSSRATPRVAELALTYLRREVAELSIFKDILITKGLMDPQNSEETHA